MGARGQPRHQPAGGDVGRGALQDLPHLREDDRVNIAVTGASGFIGRHVVARSDRARRGRSLPVKRPFEAAALARAVRGADVVVHLAGVVVGLARGRLLRRRTSTARAPSPKPLVRPARGWFISRALRRPARRRQPHRGRRTTRRGRSPPTAAASSKASASWSACPVCAGSRFGPGVVYGPGDRALLPLFRMAAAGYLPLVGRLDAAYAFIHIADAVRAIGAAVDSAVDREAIFVAHSRPAPVRELVEAIRDAAGGAARGSSAIPMSADARRRACRRCRRRDARPAHGDQLAALCGVDGGGLRLPRRSPARRSASSPRSIYTTGWRDRGLVQTRRG